MLLLQDVDNATQDFHITQSSRHASWCLRFIMVKCAHTWLYKSSERSGAPFCFSLNLNVPTATDADQEPNEGENDFSNLLNKFQEANTNTDSRYSLWFYAGPDTNIYSKHRLWETHTDRRSLRIIIFEKRRKTRVQPKTRSVAYTSPHALSHSVIRMLVAVVYCRVMGSGWGSADIGANISLCLSLPHTHTRTHTTADQTYPRKHCDPGETRGLILLAL